MDFLPIRYEEIIVEVTEGVMRLLLEKVTHIKCHAMPLKLKVMLISCSYQSYAHIAHLIKGLAGYGRNIVSLVLSFQAGF